MAKANALSQQEDHAIGIEDNKGILFIPLEQIHAVLTWITDVGDHIQDQIQEYTKAHDLAESYKNYDEEDRILSRDGKIFVPDDDNLWMEIVRLHHDMPLAGHLGQEKMLELLERSYFWLGMSTYVKNYVSWCDRCACFKGSNVALPGKLQPLDISNMPWVDLSADFITDLPLFNGYDLILVVVDRFSKEVEYIPCNKIVTALEMAKLYLFHVWKNHGLPHTIVSDHGPQFASQMMKDLYKHLGIIPKLSTAHHPQTDGQTEWMNHDLQQCLRIFTVERQNEWADWIALAQFSYNTKQQASTRKSPFEVTCTYSSWMGIEKRSTKAPAVDLLVEEISNTLESVKKNLKQAQDKMKSQADKHRSDTPIYQPGDQVWLSTDNLCLPQKSKKLSEKWIGPYPVVKMVGTNAVKLPLPHSM